MPDMRSQKNFGEILESCHIQTLLSSILDTQRMLNCWLLVPVLEADPTIPAPQVILTYLLVYGIPPDTQCQTSHQLLKHKWCQAKESMPDLSTNPIPAALGQFYPKEPLASVCLSGPSQDSPSGNLQGHRVWDISSFYPSRPALLTPIVPFCPQGHCSLVRILLSSFREQQWIVTSGQIKGP